MSIEEIKQSESWQFLNRNAAFADVFERTIMKNAMFAKYLKFKVRVDSLIVTLETPILQGAENAKYKEVSICEFTIYDDDSLFVYKKNGTITTAVGEKFDTSDSGVLETKYSSVLYDKDGIVLSYQRYIDEDNLSGVKLSNAKKDLERVIEDAYNPHLNNSVVDKLKICIPPGIIGTKAKYVRRYRENNKLGLVHAIACSYKQDSTLKYINHNLYFCTLSSEDHINFNPEDIIFDKEDLFATVDLEGNKHISSKYAALKINEQNCQEYARERFLNELIKDRDTISKTPDKAAIEAMYDIMIKKLEEEPEKEKGTNK